jgi:hypothetical protein
MDASSADTIHVEAFVVGNPMRVQFVVQNQRPYLPMQPGQRVELPLASGPRDGVIWTTAIPSAQLQVRPLVVGMQALIGGPIVTDSSGKETYFPLNAWFPDASVPPVSVAHLASDAQSSPHVLNVRNDDLSSAFRGVRELDIFSRLRAWAPAIRRFYDVYPDSFDYLAIIPPLRFGDGAAGEHLGYRSATVGIGQAPFDRSAFVSVGSGSRLQSILYYANPIGADFAASTFSHEMAHRWMVRLSTREFSNSPPHWPISDLADGLMGFGVSGNSGRFPHEIVKIGDGRYRFQGKAQAQRFNSMELYMMGLMPAGEVTETYRVFEGVVPDAVNGVEFSAPVRAFTIDSMLALVGPRDPSFVNSPKEFHVGTIVISRGRLLTVREMAMFEYLVARGEARVAQVPISDSADGNAPTVLPFFVATGQRGVVTTALRPVPGFTTVSRSASRRHMP